MTGFVSAAVAIVSGTITFIRSLPHILSFAFRYAMGILLHCCMAAERRVQGGAELVLALVLAAPFAAIYAWVLLT